MTAVLDIVEYRCAIAHTYLKIYHLGGIVRVVYADIKPLLSAVAALYTAQWEGQHAPAREPEREATEAVLRFALRSAAYAADPAIRRAVTKQKLRYASQSIAAARPSQVDTISTHHKRSNRQ